MTLNPDVLDVLHDPLIPNPQLTLNPLFPYYPLILNPSVMEVQ